MISHDEMLSELLELDSNKFRLNDYEIRFIDDLDKQILNGKPPTVNQAKLLVKIHKMACVTGRRERF